MSEPNGPASSLNERISAEIEALAQRGTEPDWLVSRLGSPVTHSRLTGLNRDDLLTKRWSPKALADGVFAEPVVDDPLIGVLAARRISPGRLLVRFLLKLDDIGPVRCVVIVNGRQSNRVSIKNGKVGRRRTTAELILDIAAVSDQTDAVFIEVVRDERLFYFTRLPAQPSSPARWIAQAAQAVARHLHLPWTSVWSRRPIRVGATRLLEESFRIKSS